MTTNLIPCSLGKNINVELADSKVIKKLRIEQLKSNMADHEVSGGVNS